ncbi:hypothetical protein H0H92_014233 [Tricholoma furcatifolium]|nr:hypothetical protein H0H92_014233 [Tricholoma furcatifolium]
MTLSSSDQEYTEELKVTFYPQLYLQRRIWILDVMRAEKVTRVRNLIAAAAICIELIAEQVLDIGCGEGQLLSVLCQPAPWLLPPPAHILPPLPDESSEFALKSPLSPTYNEEIPSIHTTHIMGLDISSIDLEFAIQGTKPPEPEINLEEGSNPYTSCLTSIGLRWEDLDVKIWKGGLQVINEDFVDTQCIVSTEVIEHLPPDIFPAFAPAILGVYHPQLFLVTTPSYTFNARFTAPMAPLSARKGYLDPTLRTDRIFRHSDHKFEWTVDEFKKWCEDTAEEWGYEVEISSIGRAVEKDVWGRDAELGGATSVALFRRCEMVGREQKGRAVLQALKLEAGPHELLANHHHQAHAKSEKPGSLHEISLMVKTKMEEFREGFLRIEELWFERDIAILCGGWIEMLVRAVEQSEFFTLKRDGEEMKGKRENWVVELVGAVIQPKGSWSKNEETALDTIPLDWVPADSELESSEGEWGGSTDMDGDISWNESEGEDDVEDSISLRWTQGEQWDAWQEDSSPSKRGGWGTIGTETNDFDIPDSEGNSTAGWDGDASDETS